MFDFRLSSLNKTAPVLHLLKVKFYSNYLESVVSSHKKSALSLIEYYMNKNEKVQVQWYRYQYRVTFYYNDKGLWFKTWICFRFTFHIFSSTTFVAIEWYIIIGAPMNSLIKVKFYLCVLCFTKHLSRYSFILKTLLHLSSYSMRVLSIYKYQRSWLRMLLYKWKMFLFKWNFKSEVEKSMRKMNHCSSFPFNIVKRRKKTS